MMNHDADATDACEHCGEENDELHGLDLVGNFVDWVPCCEGTRDAVAHYGWAAVFGCTLEADIERVFGLRPQMIADGSIHDRTDRVTGETFAEADAADFLCTFPLRVVDPTAPAPARKGDAPAGQGVGRVQSPAGWREQIFAAVAEHHRHHQAPQGYKFGVEVYNGFERVGVAVVGRPVSRQLAAQEPATLEVIRVTTWGDAWLRRNASSKLYAACAKTARKAGCTKLVTYTLESENGASLKASSFTAVHTTKGESWDREARKRGTTAPTCKKTRWERTL